MASYNLGKVVGDDGVSLEYDWEGTSLGIKRDDEAEYTYVDLKGEKGDTGSTGASGSNGKDGADGYSPTVSTSKEGKTTTIEITDKNGTHTATIQDGADGSNGVDGTSPTASISKSGNTATITITDKNGTTIASVSDGANGTNGRDGYVQYTAGDNITISNNVISATDTTYSAGSNISITNGEISADLSSKQDTIDSSHKLSSDLVDDTNATNLFVSSSEKTTWSGKQDTLISGTNIKTINNTTLLGNGNIDTAVNPTITTDSGTTYTIASLVGNQTYKLGELTSLTITATTTFDIESIIYFTSGSTPTDISIPDSITNIGDAPTMTTASNVNTGTCEASKSYIIAILNNIAVWKAY